MVDPNAKDATLSLFDTYADKIYEFARYSLGNNEDAEDLVQEVFVRVYRTWGTVELENPSAWIWTIARNLVRDAYRRRSRHKEGLVADFDQWAVPSRPPDTLVEVEDVLQQLTELERQVVYFRLIEDMSVETTARIVDTSAVNVRVTLHRAIRKLRILLSDDTPPARALQGQRRTSR